MAFLELNEQYWYPFFILTLKSLKNKENLINFKIHSLYLPNISSLRSLLLSIHRLLGVQYHSNEQKKHTLDTRLQQIYHADNYQQRKCSVRSLLQYYIRLQIVDNLLS